MRILILGGTAFLSAGIARQAVDAGHDVTCLARGMSGEPPSGVRWIRADRSNAVDAYPVEVGWDAVVEVAGDPAQAISALQALAHRTGHWTFVSSCSVYADHSIPGETEHAKLRQPLPGSEPYNPEKYGEAKVAIEQATLASAAGKAHICRAGLISGPGDPTDRYGYWPARFARNQEELEAGDASGRTDTVLLPDIPDAATQVIDVRDLARWILESAERGTTGTFNAVGDVVPFREYIDESRRQAGHLGGTVVAGEEWLLERGVAHWSGPDSLPLWLPRDHDGFCSRSNAAARLAGLTLRPWRETLRDTLEDERRRGLGRERRAGLSPGTEARLVGELKAEVG